MQHKSMPMYLFFIGAACLILIVPVVAAQLIDRFFYSTEPNPIDDPSEWVETVFMDAGDWGTESWKAQLDEQLRSYDMHVLVTSPEQTSIYQYHTDQPNHSDGLIETYTETAYKTNVYHDEEWLGSVYLSFSQPRLVPAENTSDHVILKSMFAIIGLLLLVFLYLIRRQILKPIQSLIQASNKVAAGQYDAQLATSSIKELRAVSEAYSKMSTSLAELDSQRQEHEADRRFLISSIVHDLRTPLFSLKGYLEGITQGIAQTEAKKTQYLDRSIELTHRLEGLISMLSQYSESLLSAEELNLRSVEMTSFMDQVIQGLNYPLEQKQLTIVKKYAVTQTVNIDQALMHRAFENVFINAIRFSPKQGSIQVIIEQQHTNGIRICIQDEGPGFPEQDLGEVFKPLYQADRSRGPEHPGIGLGLAISKTIIERHHGRIHALNRPHQGAALVIEIRQ